MVVSRIFSIHGEPWEQFFRAGTRDLVLQWAKPPRLGRQNPENDAVFGIIMVVS